MVAAVVDVEDVSGRSGAGCGRVLFGVARRLPALERDLMWCDRRSGLAGLVTPAHLAPLAPIDDARATPTTARCLPDLDPARARCLRGGWLNGHATNCEPRRNPR